MSRLLPLTLIILAQAYPLHAAIPEITEPESYEIYSHLIAAEIAAHWPMSVRVGVTRETQRGPLPMCIEPPPGQDALYRPMINDFEQRNASRLALQPKLKLSSMYMWVDPKQTREFLADPKVPSVLFEVSAVGYNQDRTRALVYVGHHCGRLCGSGMYYLLVQRAGRWELDSEYRGVPSCVWAS